MDSQVTHRGFSEAVAQAMAAGLKSPQQIKQAVRRHGEWFITWVVSA